MFYCRKTFLHKTVLSYIFLSLGGPTAPFHSHLKPRWWPGVVVVRWSLST